MGEGDRRKGYLTNAAQRRKNANRNQRRDRDRSIRHQMCTDYNTKITDDQPIITFMEGVLRFEFNDNDEITKRPWFWGMLGMSSEEAFNCLSRDRESQSAIRMMDFDDGDVPSNLSEMMEDDDLDPAAQVDQFVEAFRDNFSDAHPGVPDAHLVASDAHLGVPDAHPEIHMEVDRISEASSPSNPPSIVASTKKRKAAPKKKSQSKKSKSVAQPEPATVNKSGGQTLPWNEVDVRYRPRKFRSAVRKMKAELMMNEIQLVGMLIRYLGSNGVKPVLVEMCERNIPDLLQDLYDTWAAKERKMSKPEKYYQLAVKDRLLISNDTWDMFLSFFPQTGLVKSGTLMKVADHWNRLLISRLGLSAEGNAVEVDVKAVCDVMRQHSQILDPDFPLPDVMDVKFSFDGRKIGCTASVVLALVALNLGQKIHNMYSQYPLKIYNGSESATEVKDMSQQIIAKIAELSNPDRQDRISLRFFLGGDLKAQWNCSDDTRR